MFLSLDLRYARIRYLLDNLWARLTGRAYIVYSTPSDFRRLLLRKGNQRRERGNVARYLGRRSGRYNVTSAILLALLLNGCSPTTEPRSIAVDCMDANGHFIPCNQ